MVKKILKNRLFRIILFSLIALAVLGTSCLCGINAHVVRSTRGGILDFDDAVTIEDFDCVLVLGCLVKSDGTLSHMLSDRMEVAVKAFHALKEKGGDVKLLVSGDHGSEGYNEVAAMKKYAVDNLVDSNDIFMDHAGFSTYESIYRAKEIFGVKKMLIVTQEYHLHRALYIAESLGVEAYGLSADLRDYSGQLKYSIREVLARNKDFFTSLIKPKPKYLGERIDLGGNGDVTND